jgi:enoyl-CoA hydratase
MLARRRPSRDKAPMDLASLTIDPRRLWAGEQWPDLPLALVDLEAASNWPERPVLPPFPVIGLGPRDHPLAAALDTVVELPVSAAGIAGQVIAQPRAAEVVVQLLRLLQGMPPDAGLTAESLAYAALQGGAAHAAWLAVRPPADAGPPGALRVEREGALLLLTLDRAGQGNAIDRPLRDALHESFALAALDARTARVVLRGRGRCFSLGAELGEFGTTRDPAEAHAIRMRSLPARALLGCAERLEVHVQGACIGAGLEIAAFARRIVAARNAWFQLPELAMGLLPGAGGCVSLTRRIGRQRAALMILSGRRVSAALAHEWGLVDALVDELPADDGGAHVV